jgi:hypothetical protein
MIIVGGQDGNGPQLVVFNDAWVLGPTTSGTCGVPPPVITSVFPYADPQGQTIPNFAVNGSSFDTSATLSFGGVGVQVNSYFVRTATQIVASISIAPAAVPGTRDVIVTNSDGQQFTLTGGFTVNLSPPTINQPDIGVSPNSLAFGAVPVHGSVTKSVFVQNTGTASLSVSGITSTDRSFTVFPQSFVLDPGRFFTVGVTFSPVGPGTTSGVLKITSNAPRSAIIVSMTGAGATPQVGHITLVSSNDTSPTHPLYISAANIKPRGNKVFADVTITNVTGTWYELDLVSNSPPVGPPFPIPVQQQIPFAFLIGPFQQTTFKSVEFHEGQYLQFDATTLSISASAIFGLDMVMRAVFGIELNPVTGILDISTGVVSGLISAVGKNCTGTGVAFNFATDINRRDLWSLINDAAQFMGCTVSNQQLRDAVSQLLSQLYGNEVATKWIQIGAGTFEGVLFAFTHVTEVVALADQTINANPHGWVRLKARRP